ncbi:MAG: VOC family protein [Alphaproteobacteria bacterium]|nr:VOC family protein [Alphaproteobacteria bacterium]
MRPLVSMITLGVRDLQRAFRFFHDGLGWPSEGILGADDAEGGVAFFPLETGLVIALWPRTDLAADSGVSTDTGDAVGIALAHNTRSPAEVDQVLDDARAAGATVVKPGQETFWGGYAGYFRDPEGHLWEVAWNPHLLPPDPA